MAESYSQMQRGHLCLMRRGIPEAPGRSSCGRCNIDIYIPRVDICAFSQKDPNGLRILIDDCAPKRLTQILCIKQGPERSEAADCPIAGKNEQRNEDDGDSRCSSHILSSPGKVGAVVPDLGTGNQPSLSVSSAFSFMNHVVTSSTDFLSGVSGVFSVS